jgi:hypothetical protein
MATRIQITRITPPIAPRLPASPVEYDRRFQEQYSGFLRLYFNGLDTTFTSLLGSPKTVGGQSVGHPGGAYLNFPYIAVQRTTDKTFTANTATLITFDTTDYNNDCRNDTSNGLYVNNAGIYNYQFSVQWANSDTQEHDAWVWLRKNGVDIAGTASQFSVISRHGGVNGHVLGAANFFIQLDANDYVEMWAAVSSATVYMESYPVQTTPFAMPSIPSVVATLSFVSSIPA